MLAICWIIRMDGGQWTPASRAVYNLRDTVARCTTQVYTKLVLLKIYQIIIIVGIVKFLDAVSSFVNGILT